MGRSLRRALAVTATVVALVLGEAGPAAADPPGPTDYRSEITAIEPPTDGVEVEIVGGDSFIRLRRTGDERVDVVGYGGEPYLRFEPDGRVLENQRSPATFLNRDRTGDVDLPTEADADAEPVWEEVAADGTFSWHDHRTHWMSSARPPGRSPGDRVLEGVVPLRVGDRDVDVDVASTWVAGPSPVPAVVGALVGLVGAVLLVVRRPGTSALALVAGATSATALALGLASYLSVPSDTGPRLTLWALPLVGVVAAVAAGVLRRLQPPVRAGLVAVAGIELLWWAWTRQAALTRALIPTDAPPALDRAVVAAVAVLAVGLLVAAGRAGAGDLAGTGPRRPRRGLSHRAPRQPPAGTSTPRVRRMVARSSSASRAPGCTSTTSPSPSTKAVEGMLATSRAAVTSESRSRTWGKDRSSSSTSPLAASGASPMFTPMTSTSSPA